VTGSGHDHRSGDLSEVIGSERPATDVGTHPTPTPTPKRGIQIR